MTFSKPISSRFTGSTIDSEKIKSKVKLKVAAAAAVQQETKRVFETRQRVQERAEKKRQEIEERARL